MGREGPNYYNESRDGCEIFAKVERLIAKEVRDGYGDGAEVSSPSENPPRNTLTSSTVIGVAISCNAFTFDAPVVFSSPDHKPQKFYYYFRKEELALLL